MDIKLLLDLRTVFVCCVLETLVWITFAYPEEVRKETCNMETFNATCPPGHVILVREARYGRMNVGRCVKKNLGYVGCAVNVDDFLDTRCSGRRQCVFTLPDPKLYNTKPCPDDTTPYLESAYTCVKVATSSNHRCTGTTPLVVSQPSGIISSSTTVESGFGTRMCPWKIQAEEGQTINMTVYSFNGGTMFSEENSNTNNPGACYEYATIDEPGQPSAKLTICGGSGRKERVYKSRASTVSIEVRPKSTIEDLGTFLIKYQAVGCPDLKPPTNGYVTRKGDTSEIKCNSTSDTWFITCDRATNRWIGNRGNCSGGQYNYHSKVKGDSTFPYGILIVVAIGVALGVFVGGLLLLCVSIYMKRRHAHRQEMSDMQVWDPKYGEPHPCHDWHPSPKHDTLLRQGYHDAVMDPNYSRGTKIQGVPQYQGSETLRSKHHVYECPTTFS